MATYVERLKQVSPQGFEELSKLMSYTANEQYGGVPQDWQAQIFTPIDTSKVPKEIPFTKPNEYLIKEYDSEGNVTKEEVTTTRKAGSQLLRYGQTPAGYDFVYERDTSGEFDVPTGYKKSIGNVNGLPVTAFYDLNGGLKGFEGAEDKRNWLSGNQSVSGKWDASGKPEPKTYTSRGGGLLGSIASDPFMGKIANIGAAYFGGPLGSAAWQLAQGNDLGDAAKAAAMTYAAQQIGGTETDPNAVGGVYGPDNIDVGGGWNPAAGATVAELEAARFALENPTIDQITADISGGNIDLGGGISINPDGSINGGTFTGSGDSFLGEAGGLGGTVNASQITNDIAGDNIDAGGGWSPATGATEAELAQARAAMAATGWTMSQALDAVRAGLLINAVTGDPLNLGGGQPEQAPAGPVGFEMVPIPAEWKSPTYAASSAPIDLSTIFSNQNMLGGTQWQGLPSQRNVSFNDIFAAGQQQTPMGTPVDINQIVSSILGQAATSQKPA